MAPPPGELARACERLRGQNAGFGMQYVQCFRSDYRPSQSRLFTAVTALPEGEPRAAQEFPTSLQTPIFRRESLAAFAPRKARRNFNHFASGTCFGAQNSAHGKRNFSSASHTCDKNSFCSAALPNEIRSADFIWGAKRQTIIWHPFRLTLVSGVIIISV